VHVISADTHTNRRKKCKVILGPAGRTLCVRPAGKNIHGGSYVSKERSTIHVGTGLDPPPAVDGQCPLQVT